MPTNARQLSDTITSTLNAFEKAGTVQDTIFGGDPMLALLDSKGKKQVKGGDPIRVNLRIGKNPFVGSYRDSEELAVGEIDTLAHADYEWSQYSGAFEMPMSELLKNDAGPKQVVSLVKERLENTALSLRDEMLEHLYGDGTGNNGKDILGFGALISDVGILGGIDRADHPEWRANVYDAAGKTLTSQGIKSRIRAIRGPGGRPEKQGKVDTVLVSGNTYDYLESILEGKLRFNMSDLSLGKLGFDAIRIAGAEVTWTDMLDDDEILYFSTEYMGIRVMPGRDFATETVDHKTMLANNKDVYKAFILWMGQMVASNCRYLGRDKGWALPADGAPTP